MVTLYYKYPSGENEYITLEYKRHDGDEDGHDNIQHQKTQPNPGIDRCAFSALVWWKSNTHKLELSKSINNY